MHKTILFAVFLLALPSGLWALPALEFEAGPGVYAPLGGWSKNLGAGPVLSLRAVHPWKPGIAFGAGIGFVQLRGKEDRDLVYQGVEVTTRAGYRLLRMRSGQEVWAWAGGGALRSQVALSGGKETSTDPLFSLGFSGSVPVAQRLRLALETRYDEVLATRQHARGVSLGLALRIER